MNPRVLALAGMTWAAASVFAQDSLDRVTDALSFSSFNDQLRTRISGLADAEFYYFDGAAPGLIDTSGNTLFNPRLSLFLDGQVGPYVYFFLQGRIDRGFDPADHPMDGRLDEYAVRVTPWADGRFNFQAGQFATIIGNWVPRHLSWDNPFISAPLSYEHLTAIYDSEAPQDVAHFLSFNPAEAYEYNPVLWGPVYATGASVAGRIEKFEYAAEIKNAGPSSRPEAWAISDTDFEHPTLAGRLAYNPDLRWNFGVSGSVGPYFRSEASETLPAGRNIGDYRQILLGQDVRFEWHHLQVWAEVFESRFEVPNVGNADTVVYYIETKYKFTPQFFGALRWNQQFFSPIQNSNQGEMRWGDDLSRVDASLGYRFTAHAQFKLQYSIEHNLPLDDFNNLVAAQFTLKF
jgi:hypothetical protein